MGCIRCESLVKSFGGVVALADVTVELPSSLITAIIGPNGAGKTTLLDVITGFAMQEAGRVFLGNEELTHLAPQQIARKGVARTFQEVRLIRHMAVLENVMLARPRQDGEHLFHSLFTTAVSKQESLNREKAFQLLQLLQLHQHAYSRAGDLSYGQLKLLAIASCLATEAEVLLLDEPIAGLHQEMTKHVISLLQRLSSEGKTIVFTEHDIPTVKEVSNHLIVMDEGKVIAEGSPTELLERDDIVEAYLA